MVIHNKLLRSMSVRIWKYVISIYLKFRHAFRHIYTMLSYFLMLNQPIHLILSKSLSFHAMGSVWMYVKARRLKDATISESLVCVNSCIGWYEWISHHPWQYRPVILEYRCTKVRYYSPCFHDYQYCNDSRVFVSDAGPINLSRTCTK